MKNRTYRRSMPPSRFMLAFIVLLVHFMLFESIASANSVLSGMFYEFDDVTGHIDTDTPLSPDQVIARISSPDGQTVVQATYNDMHANGHGYSYYFSSGMLPSSYPLVFVDSTVTNSTYLVKNSTPILPDGPVTAVASGGATLALKRDGTVWAWGDNAYGEIGDGTTISRSAPVKIQSLSNVMAVAAGPTHSTALLKDGTVWTWGDNTNGELGDGTTISRSIPGRVAGLDHIVAITDHLALKDDGTVWGWGLNDHGQVGDGTTINRFVPVQVTGLSDIYQITSNSQNGMALQRGGTVWSWGDNVKGQIGDGTTVQRNAPVMVPGLDGVSTITLAMKAAAALKQSGEVWVWGDKTKTGTNSNSDLGVPTRYQVQSGIVKLFGVNDGFFVQLNDGTLQAWGDNRSGQLGIGSGTANANSPITVPGITYPFAISGGSQYAVFVNGSDVVWSVGLNDLGQLGNGATGNQTSLVRVVNLANNANLTSMQVSPAELTDQLYSYTVDSSVDRVSVTTYSEDPLAVVKVNGIIQANGVASSPIMLSMGDNRITVIVTASDGTTSKYYEALVHRATAAPFDFPSSLQFTDEDANQGYIAGKLSWVNPLHIGDISEYALYFFDRDNAPLTKIADISESAPSTEFEVNAVVPAGAVKLGLYPVNNYGVGSPAVMIPFTDKTYEDTALASETLGASAIDRDPDEFQYSLLLKWNSILTPSTVSGYRLELVNSQNQVTPISMTINPSQYGVYSVELNPYLMGSAPRYIRIHSLNQAGIVSSNYTEVPLYDTNVSEPHLTSSSGGPGNDVQRIALYDADSQPGFLGGTLYWETSGAANITDYNVYFMDNQGNRLESIARLYNGSGGGSHQIVLPNGIEIPPHAVSIGIYAHNDRGESAAPVMTHLWDVPYPIATDVSWLDFNPRQGAINADLSWYASYDESGIAGYRVYFVDANGNNMGSPIQDVAKGQRVYHLTISGNIPDAAKYIRIYTVDTEGNLSPVLYALSVADNISEESPDSIPLIASSRYQGDSFTDRDGDSGQIGGLVNWSSFNSTNDAYRVYFVDQNRNRLKPIAQVPGYGGFANYEITVPVDTSVPAGAVAIGIFAYSGQTETLYGLAPIQDRTATPSLSGDAVHVNKLYDGSYSISILNLQAGDHVRIYRDAYVHYPLAFGTVADGQTSLILLGVQLGTDAGSIGVAVTRQGYVESNRIMVSYGVKSDPGQGQSGGGGGGLGGSGSGGGGGGGIIIPPVVGPGPVGNPPSNGDKPKQPEPSVITNTKLDDQGRTIVTAKLNDKTLDSFIKQQLEQNQTIGDKKVIALVADGQADKAQFQLGNSALGQLTRQADNSVLALQSQAGQLYIPANAIQQSAMQLGGNDGTVTVSIAQVSDDTRKTVDQVLAKNGWSSVVDPVDYQLQISDSNGQTHDVDRLDAYIGHGLILPDSLQLASNETLVGLVVDPVTGEAFSVPMKIENHDGKQIAVLYRKGNSIYTVVKRQSKLFTDVAPTSYAAAAVQTLSARGILTGYDNGAFQPDQSVTRAEFATMIANALDLKPDRAAEPKLTDVKTGDWFVDAVTAAYQNKLISGYEDGSFRPNNTISRQEIAIILQNALTYVNYVSSSSNPKPSLSDRYKDYSDIAVWARDAVALNTNVGIVGGTDQGTYNPLAAATRAECAVMIQRLLQTAGLSD